MIVLVVDRSRRMPFCLCDLKMPPNFAEMPWKNHAASYWVLSSKGRCNRAHQHTTLGQPRRASQAPRHIFTLSPPAEGASKASFQSHDMEFPADADAMFAQGVDALPGRHIILTRMVPAIKSLAASFPPGVITSRWAFGQVSAPSEWYIFLPSGRAGQ